MRILYHHRTLGDGAEGVHIREMIRAFRNLGHEVRVIGPIGEPSSRLSRKSRILGSLKQAIPSVLYEVLEIAYSCYAFWKTAIAIRNFRPTFIYERYVTFNAGTVVAGMAFHVPVCLEVNAPLALERSGEVDEKLTLRRIASGMERWVCSHATQTVVVSTPLKEYLESIGVPGGKCVVMPNGVDPDHFSPRKKEVAILDALGIDAQTFIVGFTGVLRPWHGLELLIEAVANMNEGGRKAFVIVVGDGPYRGPLERMVADRGQKQSVCITGRIPYDRVPAYVSLFDVAVSPRATFYASPMKVIEYMALGKPVVVPRTQNFLDFVDEGVNGLMFEDGNVTALEEALAYLCAFPDRRRELGLRAREKVEGRLNWRWNARRSCDLMQPSC